MMDKKYYKYSLTIIINLLVGILAFLVMRFLGINVFTFKNICILMLVVIITCYCLDQKLFKNEYINLSIYICLLILIMFVRPINDRMIVSDIDYIIKWIKLIFTNKIVFRNLIGNILLFIPFGIFFRKLNQHIYLGLLMIVSIELTQLLLRVGIFDVIDIILNFIGFLIGYLSQKKKR